MVELLLLLGEFITAASDYRNSEITGVQVNSLPKNIYEIDNSFKKWVKIVNGDFDISEPNTIIIGKSLSIK